MRKVAIVMGSDSDLNVMRPCAETLKALGVPFCVRVLSAHRTPEEARSFALNARADGFGAIIAAAGKAAHLAGAMAANTTLPVIGVPVKSSTLDGLDGAFVHRADAAGNAGGHRGHRRGQERRAAGRADHRCGRY